MAEDAFDRVRRTAPDTEKSEDVVNAERVKIIAHLRETFFPPREAIGGHAWPVVSREAPVLSLRGEWVGWRAGLHVCVKKFWRLPHVCAVPMHADGNVTFYHEAALMHVRRRVAQL